jgi:hypothetical protein
MDELKEQRKEIRNFIYEITKDEMKQKIREKSYHCDICNCNVKGWTILKHHSSKKHKLNLLSPEEREFFLENEKAIRLEKKILRRNLKEQKPLTLDFTFMEKIMKEQDKIHAECWEKLASARLENSPVDV